MPRANKAARQSLQLLVSDGSMEFDGRARKVASQLISDIEQGIAMPGRKMATPTYIHRELNRAPAKHDGVHFETVDPITVEYDSQFLNHDAVAVWDLARTDLGSEGDDQRRHMNWMQWVFFAAACCVMVFAMFMFAHASEREAEAEAQQANEAQKAAPKATPTPVIPVIPRIGGN